MNAIEIKLLSNQCLPTYATSGAAGLDLRAVLDTNHAEIYPNETLLVNTGIAINLADSKLCGLVVPRSGLASKGLVLGNSIGIIDSDYQGEIKVLLLNNSNRPIKIENRDRIAQLLIMTTMKVTWEIILGDFSPSTRGDNGFGSTGTN